VPLQRPQPPKFAPASQVGSFSMTVPAAPSLEATAA
jgi:hypothetical protein